MTLSLICKVRAVLATFSLWSCKNYVTENQIRIYAICTTDLFYDNSGVGPSVVEVFDILGFSPTVQ